MSADEQRARGRDEQTWPEPGTTQFRLHVLNADGEPCTRFSPRGPVEVTLLASEQPVGAGGREGLQFVVLPLAFPNYPIAREHAHAIDTACKLFETAIADALEHADDPIPTKDDGHKHVVRLTRYSRTIPFSAECEICMHTLVEDVVAWARDRGIVVNEHSPVTNVHERRGTIVAAIEQTFNREGGLT